MNGLRTSQIYTGYIFQEYKLNEPIFRMNGMNRIKKTAVVMRMRCISIASAKRR